MHASHAMLVWYFAEKRGSQPDTGGAAWCADALLQLAPDCLQPLWLLLGNAAVHACHAMQTTHLWRAAPEQVSSVVLVAKALTKSDTGGRVILPRVSVESNLRFLIGFRRVAAASSLLQQQP